MVTAPERASPIGNVDAKMTCEFLMAGSYARLARYTGPSGSSAINRDIQRQICKNEQDLHFDRTRCIAEHPNEFDAGLLYISVLANLKCSNNPRFASNA